MKKLLYFGALCALVLCTSCEKKTETSEEKEVLKNGISQPLNELRLAGELAKYGYANNSPLALAQAAEMISASQPRSLESKETKEGDKNENVGDKSSKLTLDVTTLIADAKTLAGDDANMLAVVEGVKQSTATPTRGRTLGPGSASRKVWGESYITDLVTFDANALAEVGIIGDGDTDLDLYVYDENGNLIGSDADYSGNCYVSWVPRRTGTFLVKVLNRGKVYNDYSLITN